MPEMPEVETMRRGLMHALEGAKLMGLKLHRPNLRYPFPQGFADAVEGAKVLSLDRRAKYLLFHLDNERVWVTHLGMTGRFQVTDSDGPLHLDGAYYHAVRANPKHLHVQVLAEKAGVQRVIDFYDPRRFGFMKLLRPEALLAEGWYKGLGIEPLSDALSGAWLYERVSKRHTPLKALLMDQSLISGLGNIYVCEALWRAGLSPERKGSDLSLSQASDLSLAIRTVLDEAVAAGGSSISDFASASGELGYFQHRFSVYDRKDKPCVRSGCDGVIIRRVHAGRSSFFCETCQR
jgi:formamidopyrimidine-DNA glycosylase